MKRTPRYVLINPFFKIGFHYIGKTMIFDSLTRLYHFRHTLAIEFLAYAMKRNNFTESARNAMKRHKELNRFLDNAEVARKSDFDSLLSLTEEMFSCDALQAKPVRSRLVSSLDKLEKSLWKLHSQRNP